jgi:hypothetical protein
MWLPRKYIQSHLKENKTVKKKGPDYLLSHGEDFREEYAAVRIQLPITQLQSHLTNSDHKAD